MQNVLGVIFADSHYAKVQELSAVRPIGALPVGGRYRIIDFVLSNMVNSGMINVAVVTQNNYHSLMGHLGSGKTWNLARKRYGLTLFPPFSNISSTGSDSRIDILYGILGFLKRSSQEYVLLADSNLIVNATFNSLFKQHIEDGSDITLIYQDDKDVENEKEEAYIYTDENNNITGVDLGMNVRGSDKKYFGYILINKNVLIDIIEQSKVRGRKGYITNIIDRNIGKLKMKAYPINCYARRVTNINNYYKYSMEFLKKEVREEIFNNEHAIYTKTKDMTPTQYLENANVKNSFIADGCKIDGTVENSIIARSVVIKKGTVIKNSIILQQSEIGANVRLENVITDKMVIVRDDVELVGTKDFPVVVGKGRII